MADDYITGNFRRSEFACKCGCGADYINKDFVELLQIIRDYIDDTMIITSGVRCIDYNARQKNSSPTSKHLIGIAADIAIPDSHTRYLIISKAIELGIIGIGVGKNFVHLDYRRSGPRLWTY